MHQNISGSVGGSVVFRAHWGVDVTVCCSFIKKNKENFIET